MDNHLPENLKFLRTRLGYSQIQAAKKIGIPNKNLSDYERGKSVPPEEIAKKIEKFYAVTHEELFRTKLNRSIDVIIQNIKTLIIESGLPINEMLEKFNFNTNDDDDYNEYRDMIINKNEPDFSIIEAVCAYMRKSGYPEKKVENFDCEYIDENIVNVKEFKKLQLDLAKKIPNPVTNKPVE